MNMNSKEYTYTRIGVVQMHEFIYDAVHLKSKKHILYVISYFLYKNIL